MKTPRPLSLILSLVSVIVLIPCNTSGRDPSSGDPFLWETRINSCTLYIAGTVHTGRKDYYPPDNRYLQYLERASLIVLEVPDDFQVLEDKMMSYIGKDSLPEEKYFRNTLDSATVDRITSIMGTDQFHKYDRYKAWVLFTQLSVKKMKLLNYDPLLAVDRYLRDRAAEKGKEILGLENAEDQFRLVEFDLPYEVQLKFLRHQVGNLPYAAEKEGHLYDAYYNNEPEEFSKIFTAKFDFDNPAQKAAYDKVFIQRNEAWADSLESLSAKYPGPIFVAVGAGHLFGPKSLLECLKNKGYDITKPVK